MTNYPLNHPVPPHHKHGNMCPDFQTFGCPSSFRLDTTIEMTDESLTYLTEYKDLDIKSLLRTLLPPLVH